MISVEEKAQVLSDALPYIEEFRDTILVIKYGGASMENKDLQESFADDVVLLNHVGINPVVVHGGGPQITEMMKRLGKEPEFVGGLRVTDAETAEIARMVLVGSINRDVVGLINTHGPVAVGLAGEDGNLIEVKRRTNPDLGFVGDVTAINTEILTKLMNERFVPVIAPVAQGADNRTYNINADTVAGEVASALSAEKLVFLTDVEGLYHDLGREESLISRITVAELDALLGSGTLSSGMIPKITACQNAVKSGVRRAHILDGRVPHALLLEVFTKEGIGTMVTQ